MSEAPGLPPGTGALLPFPAEEYAARLDGVRDILQMHGLDALLLTSRPNVAYLTGQDPAPSAPPLACVVTATGCTAIAGSGLGRQGAVARLGYSAWRADGFWQAVASVLGTGKAVGVEADHLTMDEADRFANVLRPRRGLDIAPALRAVRMVKSPAEIALLRALAQVAAAGGATALARALPGQRAAEAGKAAQEAMEAALGLHLLQVAGGACTARVSPCAAPESLADPATPYRLAPQDLAQLSCTAMVGGYGATLGRTILVGAKTMDDSAAPHRALHLASLDLHREAFGLLMPGQSLGTLASRIDALLAERQLAPFQAAPHGHLAGFMPGWESAAQIRSGNETELEPGMVIALHPTLAVPEGTPGAGAYSEEDLVLITADGPERLTG